MHAVVIARTALLLLILSPSGFGEDLPAIDKKRLPPQAQLVNGVVVPVPGEIFRVLDTFDDTNWNAVLLPELAELRPVGSSARIALSLGLVLGEGFLATSAKNPSAMRHLGGTAIRLARALGIESAALRREKSVLDSVDRRDWPAVRQEWSRVGDDLKTAMVEIKSASLSQMISLGGWLRGLEALSSLTANRYSPASAKLLLQPDMLDHFASVLANLPGRFQEDTAVIAARKSIARLRPLLAMERPAAPSQEEVRKIRQIAQELITTLCQE